MEHNKDNIAYIKKFFLELVKIMETNGNYADVLLIKEASLNISRDNINIDIDNDQDFGVKLRVFDGESFNVISMTGLDKQKLTEHATKLSKINKKNKIKLDIGTRKYIKHFVAKGNINPAKISIKEKTDMVNNLHKKLLCADDEKINKKIVNVRVMYEEYNEIKIFVNKYKQFSQDISTCFLMMLPFVKADDSSTRYYYKSLLDSGYEVTKVDEALIRKIITKTLSISKAKKLRPGKYTCLLSPELSGLLAHESFGHGMESDTLYKDRAKAKEWLGKRIAPQNVSIIDNPAFPSKNGSFFFDDEGFLAKPTYLIKNGIVKDPITDMYSVSRLKAEGLKLGNKAISNIKRSGNARAESYDHKCYARMSNTYFAHGNTNIKDMIRKVKDGLYLHYSSGGMEDPKGWHVQIQGIVAETIKNGKLTGDMFYEVGMTGYLPDILGNIIAVSNKLVIPGTGRCGKGHKEWVRVSEGGPHLLIKDIPLA
ncbi:MAG: TldD/PmbA family protein [Candidatus Woesearchaeota archaeon]